MKGRKNKMNTITPNELMELGKVFLDWGMMIVTFGLITMAIGFILLIVGKVCFEDKLKYLISCIADMLS